MRYILVAFILAACASPDAVRTGVGYRSEDFGNTEYDGPSGWVEAEWYLKPRPMVLSYSDDTKLFLANDSALRGAIGKPTTVNVEGNEAPTSDITAVMDAAKNPDGSFSWPGVALGAVALIILGIVLLKPK